ncbi:hypothetical protein BDZ45DRAFT_672472 [Acephala macrosclerotiorum]|nr:hypothetical protein BDZ45DRAFT_672472 [Acephala macrosclerotiorum]
MVNNTGTAKSDFVLLAFLSGSYGPQPYPIKRLAAYTRLRDIVQGEMRSVEPGVELGKFGKG